MRFSELIAKKDLTNRERDDLVTQARIMEAALYDYGDLVNAIKRSGFVFGQGQAWTGQQNVVFDKDGINLASGSSAPSRIDWLTAQKGRLLEGYSRR